MRLPVLVLALAGCCPLAAPLAQPPDYVALDAALKFKLDADGRITMFPDPAAGGAGEAYTPLVDPTFGEAFRNGGVLGWLALVYQGNTDIGSMADGERILTRLGRDDDVSLIQTISEPAVGPSATLLQLMAIRVAQDRGLKQVLGPLLLMAERDDGDPFVRRAAHEAAASLRGERGAPPVVDVPALAEVLADMPGGMNLVLVVQQHRLPNGRAILRWARLAGMAVTRREIERAGGSVSEAQWAGAVKLAEGLGAVPYEVCRRFGNHRVDRSVVGITLPKNTLEVPLGWSRFDGLFDVARLRQGMVAEGLDVAGEDEELRYQDDAGQFEFARRRAWLTSAGLPPAMGVDEGRQLAAAVAPDDAPFVAYLRDRTGLALPRSVEAFGLPRRVALWLPSAGDDRLRLVVSSDGEALARQLEAQLEALPRRIDGWLDGWFDGEVGDAEARKALDPVVEALEGMRVTRDGAVVSAVVSLAKVDVRKTLLALLEALP